MKIYVATRYSNKKHAQYVADLLVSLGHEVTSGWLNEKPGEDGLTAAKRDLADIDRADALLLLTSDWEEARRGGMWVELGYALALKKQIFVFGPDVENIFCLLPQIRRVAYLGEIA